MHNLAHNATIAIQPVVYGMLVLALASSAGTTRVAGQEHPRTDDGAPDLNGVWQVVGDYHQNIEPHAISGISAGSTTTLTIRPTWLAGRIPYNAAGRELQQDNAAHRIERDPAIRCHAPGIPRATYMPYPFQIIQTPEYILFAYEFAGASRIVYMNRPDFDAPADAWMGHSRGTWEGDTLVVNVAGQLGTTWLDANGNYHSDRVHVVERYTPINPSQLFYEAKTGTKLAGDSSTNTGHKLLAEMGWGLFEVLEL